jgi:hypothetical protein
VNQLLDRLVPVQEQMYAVQMVSTFGEVSESGAATDLAFAQISPISFD